MKILLRSFKNECCCYSYFLCGSRHCFFWDKHCRLLSWELFCVVSSCLYSLSGLEAGKWFHWAQVQKTWPVKKMLSFDSASFSIHQLCVIGLGFIILKTLVLSLALLDWLIFFCTAVLLSLTVHSCNYLKCAWRMKAAFPGPVLWRYMGISVKSCDFFPKVQRWKLFSKMFLTDSQSVDIRRKDALSTRALLNSFQNVKSNQTVLF